MKFSYILTELNKVFVLQGQLFLLILLGLFFRRFIVDEQFQKGLTSLILDLIFPCNIIASFQVEFGSGLIQQAGAILAISAVVQLFCWGISLRLYQGCEHGKKAVLQYSTLCSNAGFLGTPIAEGLFGGQGVLLTAIYLIPQRIMMWTVGLSFFTRSDRRSSSLKVFLNPCLIAVFLGLLQMFFQIRLPAALNQTIASLGRCNTALSLLLIGMLIANFSLHDFTDPLILYYSALRLFLIPLLVLIGGRLLQADTLLIQISVILSAMPAGATSALLAEKYNGNTCFAAGCITVSTVLSMAAIPMWLVVI